MSEYAPEREKLPPMPAAKPILEVKLNDRVTMRKAHPCGSVRWVCVRVGADIGLKCEGCGRVVQMPRSQFNRQAKKIESSADA